jgi:hypothetical protein
MGKTRPQREVVMAGLVPAIHDLSDRKDVDARAFAAPKGLRPRRLIKPRHDERRELRSSRSHLACFLMALPAAALSLFASAEPARADLKLCNRMSYVIDAAIGIDDKAATATRGWFRIDPASCRFVVH